MEINKIKLCFSKISLKFTNIQLAGLRKKEDPYFIGIKNKSGDIPTDSMEIKNIMIVL